MSDQNFIENDNITIPNVRNGNSTCEVNEQIVKIVAIINENIPEVPSDMVNILLEFILPDLIPLFTGEWNLRFNLIKIEEMCKIKKKMFSLYKMYISNAL